MSSPPPPPAGGYASAERAAEEESTADRGGVEETRKRKLANVFGNKTVGEAYAEHFGAHGMDAIPTLAQSIGARPLQIQKFYCTGEDNATRQRLAMPALEYLCQSEFRTAVISTETLLESFQPLLMPLQGAQIVDGGEVVDGTGHAFLDDRTMNLSFLDPLRVQGKERFLVGRRIYVRDSMLEVFGRFREDTLQYPRPPPDMARSASLVGSPGVGKSTLFFLAAIDQARSSNVVYYRRVEAEPISVFVMTPHKGSTGSGTDGTESGVRVWFARDVCGVSLGAEGLTALHRALIKAGVVDRGTYYTFVDGPEPNDATNLLYSNYDYQCSRKYDSSKLNDEIGQPSERLWIMDRLPDTEAGIFLDWLADQGSRRPHETKTDDSRRYHGGDLRALLAAYERETREQADGP